MLNTGGNIYIGGGPDPPTLTGGRWGSGFSGCVHVVSFNGKDARFQEDSVSTANVLPCNQ